MKPFFLFLAIFITGCFSTDIPNFKDCENFSTSYTNTISLFKKNSSTTSWKSIKDFHGEVLKNLIRKWPQNNKTLQDFSSFFFPFLRTRIFVECGFLEDFKNPSKVPVQLGTNRLEYKEDDLQTCIIEEWKKTKSVLFQACTQFFEKE